MICRAMLGFEIDGGIQAMDYSALTTLLAENKLDIELQHFVQ